MDVLSWQTPCRDSQCPCLDSNQVFLNKSLEHYLYTSLLGTTVLNFTIMRTSFNPLHATQGTYIKTATAEEVGSVISIVFVSVAPSVTYQWADKDTGYPDHVFSWFFWVIQANAGKIPQLGQDPFFWNLYRSFCPTSCWQHHKNLQPPKRNKEQAFRWNIYLWRFFKKGIVVLYFSILLHLCISHPLVSSLMQHKLLFSNVIKITVTFLKMSLLKSHFILLSGHVSAL
jgi:hypothetical protein